MGFSVRSLGRPQDRRAALLLPPLALVFLALLGLIVAYDTSRVVGESMLPGLRPEDRLLVTRSYQDPARGDVVVLETGDGDASRTLVKRVVGLPGDHVEYRGDVVTVNGSPAVGPGARLSEAIVPVGSLVVPEGSVFVVGDNRPVSLDSRFFGPVPTEDVQGRALAVFSPVTRIRLVDDARSPD